MAMPKGITIFLFEEYEMGTDGFNHAIYGERPVEVDNVLVAPVSSTELLETYNLTGRRAVYQLAIPKGDEHEWKEGGRVNFFGEDWRIIAIPTEGIEDLIPLSWNKKVQVERYG